MFITDNNSSRQVPFITFILVFINVVAFIFTVLRPDFGRIVWEYGFIPQQFQFLDLITSMFLHGDIEHIVFNMLFLWVFGDNVEEKLGPGLFLLFYFCGGIFADMMYWTTVRHSAMIIPSIGASGAISAVLGFYMIFFPGAKISTWTIYGTYELEAFTYFGIWVGGQILMMVLGGQGINYVAHLTGFFFGVFIATILQSRWKSI